MKTEMQCDVASSHLPLFVGGDLEAPLAETLRGHLERCEPCSHRLAGLERARTALISTRATVPGNGSPIDLWAGIRTELANEGLLGIGAPTRHPAVPLRAGGDGFRLGLHRRLGGLAAAAALVLMLWSPWSVTPTAGIADPVLPPVAPAASGQGSWVAENGDTPDVQPVSQAVGGGLHPLLPGEERLSDSARPFPNLLPAVNTPGAGNDWSLVGDDRLR